jgi:hypothetical protein
VCCKHSALPSVYAGIDHLRSCASCVNSLARDQRENKQSLHRRFYYSIFFVLSSLLRPGCAWVRNDRVNFGSYSDNVSTLPSVAGGALIPCRIRAENVSKDGVLYSRDNGNSGLATGIAVFCWMRARSALFSTV